jgi:hypothetical protein
LEDGPPGAAFDLTADVLSPRPARAVIRHMEAGEHAVEDSKGTPVAGAECRIAEIVELAIPFAALGLGPNEDVEMLLRLSSAGQPVETIPSDEMICFKVPSPTFEAEMWSA